MFIEASDEIAGGKLERETGLRGRNDEIGYLAERFEKMVQALKHSLRKVEETNLQLEARVKERTTELAREKKRTENIIESLGDGLMTIDPNNVITYCNEAASKLISMDPRESTGIPLHRLLPFTDRKNRPISTKLFTYSKTASEPVECFLNTSERKIPVLVSFSPLSEDKAVPSGAVITIRDITNIHDLNEQIRRSDRLSSLGVLSAGVAHELNNPLGNISTYAQLMLEKVKMNEPLSEEWIQIIISEAQRGSSTVMKLLEFSRREPTVFEEVSINKIVSDSVNLFSTTLEENDISVTLNLPPYQALTMGNSNQLQQVFINLLSNGVQSFSSEATSGNSKQESENHQKCIKIDLTDWPAPEYQWKVSIEDNGCGMDDETVENIFKSLLYHKRCGTGYRTWPFCYLWYYSGTQWSHRSDDRSLQRKYFHCLFERLYRRIT